jgi:hypothetical protein
MADEIIKLIEYIAGNPVVQGAVIAYIIFGAMVVLIAVAVFVFVFRSIIRRRKRWK